MTKTIGIIIQARMNSERLPGKVLLDIGGKSMLHRLIDRLRLSIHKDIFVSASDNFLDKAISKETERLNIRSFTGDEADCMGRFIKTASYYNIDTIVRVTGDNPFTDPEHLDSAVSKFFEQFDYVGTKGLPLGTGSEVISLEALERAHRETKNKLHRENITSFLYMNSDRFKTDFISPKRKQLNRPDIRLTVDTKEDFELIKKIYDRLGDIPKLADIISLLDADTGLFNMNRHIKQKQYDYEEK